VIEFLKNHKVQDDKNQQKCQKWLKMAESQGKGLKTPVNGLLRKILDLDPYLGTIIFKTKLTHGKPL